jgi:monofunctional biosynthetic peptidoglycan transglycosylase
VGARKSRRPNARRPRKRRGLLRKILLFPVALVGGYYALCTLLLLLYTFVFPPFTGVQIQRRIESFFEDEPYRKVYVPVSGDKISDHLKHAAIAAEDGRFYEHGGIDWEAVRQAVQDNQERGRTWRGGSTITQQLAKNLFMTTHRSIIRKGAEVPLTYLTELILTKDRILVLYLNVVEFDRGVYGAEAAAQHHFNTSASKLTRRQAASLAAVLPNPRNRSPHRMGNYTNTILRRMSAMGY